jgi:hypothetical protein
VEEILHRGVGAAYIKQHKAKSDFCMLRVINMMALNKHMYIYRWQQKKIFIFHVVETRICMYMGS